jgi:enolase-phosphatase E1
MSGPIVDLPKVYLLDIEGTTSPLSLVHAVLFPYARLHLGQFLREHADEAEVSADLVLLAEENDCEEAADCPRFLKGGSLDEAGEYLLWLMDRDRKSTALKSLQGRIWKTGFLAGELVGTVFGDVPEALARWTRPPRGAKVAVYSSGSVDAQRLLFRYSSAGDLTPFVSAYFDTRVGAKVSRESYQAIAAAMGVEADEMLFISDALKELDPAREAGCWTRLSVREGNPPVGDGHGHAVISSFSESLLP